MNRLKKALRRQIPDFDARLRRARAESAIGRKIFALRKERGLTQKALADRVHTTATVISRIENADYEGHSVSLLKRIAVALGTDLEISFKEPISEPIATTQIAVDGLNVHIGQRLISVAIPVGNVQVVETAMPEIDLSPSHEATYSYVTVGVSEAEISIETEIPSKKKVRNVEPLAA